MERVSLAIARVRSEKLEIQRGEVWVPADDVVIMGQGKGDSEGIAMIGAGVVRYLTNTQIDAAFLLAKLTELADKLADLGNVSSWIIQADNQIRGANQDAQAIGNEAKAIADEAREYLLK